MKEAVSNVESIRKALQDFPAPELRGIAVSLEALDKCLDTMSGDTSAIRGELHPLEARIKDAIDQAKREILLTVQLADAEQRHAVLQRKVNELQQDSQH